MLRSTAAIVGATRSSRGTSAYGSYWPSTRPDTHARTVPTCTAGRGHCRTGRHGPGVGVGARAGSVRPVLRGASAAPGRADDRRGRAQHGRRQGRVPAVGVPARGDAPLPVRAGAVAARAPAHARRRGGGRREPVVAWLPAWRPVA